MGKLRLRELRGMAEVMSSKTLAGPHYPNSHASEQVFGELCLLGPHALYQFRLGVWEWDVLPLKSQADEKPCGLSLPHGAWKSVMWWVSLGLRQAGALKEEMLKFRFKAEGEARKLSCMLRQLQMEANWDLAWNDRVRDPRWLALFPFPVPVSSRPSLFFLPFPLLPSFSQALTTGCEICFAWRPKEAEFFPVYWKKIYTFIYFDTVSPYISLASLECTILTRLSFTSRRFACLFRKRWD